MELFKNKKIMISVAMLFIVLLGGGGMYILSSNGKSASFSPTPTSADEVVPTLTPLDLGLSFTLRPDKKAAKFEITKVDDIEHIEYQITYTKKINGEEVPEGLYGEVKVKPGDSTIKTDYREFGTCSSGVCRYDIVVSPVKLVLKVTKKDGKVYSSETTLQIQ